MIRDTAKRVSLEFTKSVGSICRARDSMYFKMVTLTCMVRYELVMIWTSGADQSCWKTAVTFRFGV